MVRSNVLLYINLSGARSQPESLEALHADRVAESGRTSPGRGGRFKLSSPYIMAITREQKGFYALEPLGFLYI